MTLVGKIQSPEDLIARVRDKVTSSQDIIDFIAGADSCYVVRDCGLYDVITIASNDKSVALALVRRLVKLPADDKGSSDDEVSSVDETFESSSELGASSEAGSSCSSASCADSFFKVGDQVGGHADQIRQLAGDYSDVACELIRGLTEKSLCVVFQNNFFGLVELAGSSDPAAAYESIKKLSTESLNLFFKWSDGEELYSYVSNAAICADQIMILTERCCPAACELIKKLDAEKLASFFKDANKVIELAGKSGPAACELIKRLSAEKLASFFKDANKVIELAGKSGPAACELIKRLSAEKLASFFKDANKVIELAGKSGPAACELIKRLSAEKLALLFKEANKVIELAKDHGPAACALIEELPAKKVASLFRDVNQIIELAKHYGFTIDKAISRGVARTLKELLSWRSIFFNVNKRRVIESNQAISALVKAQPRIIASRFKRASQVIKLVRVIDKEAAKALVAQPEVAKVFKSAKQVMRLFKFNKEAAIELIAENPAQVALCFKKPKHLIALVGAHDDLALRIVEEFGWHFLCLLFKDADKVIELARVSDPAACKVIEKLLAGSLALLFKDADKVIELACVSASAACRLIEKLPAEKLALLFRDVDKVIELARVSDSAACKLIERFPAKELAPCFGDADKVIALARVSGPAACKLIEKLPVNLYFGNVDQLIKLANYSGDAVFKLVDSFSMNHLEGIVQGRVDWLGFLARVNAEKTAGKIIEKLSDKRVKLLFDNQEMISILASLNKSRFGVGIVFQLINLYPKQVKSLFKNSDGSVNEGLLEKLGEPEDQVVKSIKDKILIEQRDKRAKKGTGKVSARCSLIAGNRYVGSVVRATTQQPRDSGPQSSVGANRRELSM